jgi:cell division protein FtsX
MQLVGATVWTVRGPLVVEGLLYGILGALLVLVLTKLLLVVAPSTTNSAPYLTGLGSGWIDWRVLLREVKLDGEFVSQVFLMGIGLSFLSASVAAVRLVRAV